MLSVTLVEDLGTLLISAQQEVINGIIDPVKGMMCVTNATSLVILQDFVESRV
jgi:hypothetical protein